MPWPVKGTRPLVPGTGVGGLFTVAWSPDGSWLADAGFEGPVQLWDTTTGLADAGPLPVSGRGSALRWSGNSRHLAIGTGDALMIWHPSDGHQQSFSTRLSAAEEEARGPKPMWGSNYSRIRDVAWSPDDLRLVTVGEDTMVKIWDLDTGRRLHLLPGHHSWVITTAWSPDGGRVATGGEDLTVRIWDPDTGRLVHTSDRHGGRVMAVAWAPDGAHLAVADEGGLLTVLDRDGREVTSVVLRPIRALDWSTKGIAVSQEDGPAVLRLG